MAGSEIDFSRADELVFGEAPPPSLADDPEAARKAGNAAFRAGKWSDALRLYSHLLTVTSDPEMIATGCANRAAVYLKLGRLDEAEQDTTVVVETARASEGTITPGILAKALHRRAVARAELNRPLDALADLKSVLEIEPQNKTSRDKFNQLKALIAATPHLAASAKDQATAQQLQPTPRKILVVDVDGQCTKPSTRPNASIPKPVKPVGIDMGSIRASLRVVKQRPILAPKTGIELEAAWKSGRENVSQRRDLLLALEPEMLPRLLQHFLTSDVVLEILQALSLETALGVDEKGMSVCDLLEALRSTSRFTMVLMFLTRTEKEDMASAFSRLEQAYPAQKPKIEAMRPLYSVL